MSLLGRYVKHPAPGTTGATGLVAGDNPWGAGRATLLRNNGYHLNEVAPIRSLWTSTGVLDFYRQSANLTVPFTAAPTVFDIDWRQTRKTGGLGLHLGHHWAWRSALRRWPRIVCRFAIKVTSTYTTGVVLAVSPGIGGPFSALGTVAAAYTDTSFTEHELAFNLNDACFASESYAPSNGISQAAIDEHGGVMGFSVYLGGYCSSNSGMSPASIVGLTLGLEIAT